MEELLPHDIELDNNDLDEIEPVGDEAQLYEHFRVVVDKGQELMRVDKYLFDRLPNASRNRIQKAAEQKCLSLCEKLRKLKHSAIGK